MTGPHWPLRIAVVALMLLPIVLGAAAVAITMTNAEDFGILLMFAALGWGLFGLSAVGCAVALRQRVWRWPMIVALGLCLFGTAGLSVAFPLAEWAYGQGGNVLGAVVTLMFALMAWAIALPHGAFWSMREIPPGGWRWARMFMLVPPFVLAGTLTVMCAAFALGYQDVIDGESAQVILFAGCLGTAIGGAALPYVAWRFPAHRMMISAPAADEPLALTVHCPRCATAQALSPGHAECRACGLRINVRIEQPACPQCGFLLYGRAAPACPECGHDFVAASANRTSSTTTNGAEAP